ncbi:Hsp20/alpha crystallin family protein [Pseudonocardia lacus]|uniref:Hsp20/alpha crystallin family protein n=1 Tax=Pseudonocardia lacus TaxID=2835865 RepID=UPI001BDCF434|nr:Hsp20/alpha crystallin family protein [Pseudonocardia lacus]
MLMRTDPFREFDRLAQLAFGGPNGPWARPTAIPMDAYRSGDEYVVELDVPGVEPSAIELSVERNVLTVKAERLPGPRDEHVEMQVAERGHGVRSRRLFLSDALDADRVRADYHAGVLTLRIPVAEQARPRTISVTAGDRERHAISA